MAQQRGQNTTTSGLGVAFERIAANERAVEAITNQVTQIATQVSSLAATTQVLANTDSTFKQQMDANSNQITNVQTKLYEIVQQLGEMKASIKQTITDAMREAQTVERRNDDSRILDARNLQQWLVTALIAILCAVLTYLFTHPIH